MKRYISPATVIATIALFVALGGSSLAAANYISGASIRPNSIPADRLTHSAIAELRRNRVQASAAPDAGPVVAALQFDNGQSVTTFKAGRPNKQQFATAYCPAGLHVVGGGFAVTGNAAKLVTTSTQPYQQSGQPEGWQIIGWYQDAKASDPPLKIYVIAKCLGATMTSPSP